MFNPCFFTLTTYSGYYRQIMLNVPTFTSENDYSSHRANIDFWWPHIVKILERHKLPGNDKREIAKCGFNPTYPVFLIDNIVIKFFGYRRNWLDVFKTECTAHEYLTNDNTILAPRILAKGHLFTDTDAFWPYIIFSKMPGQSWLDTRLTHEEKNKLTAEIGHQLRKIHHLPTDKALRHDSQWSKLNFRMALEKSVLPKHLVPQVDSFIANLDDFDRCFVNGDIVDTHVFISNGHLSGIIDWGDATVTDRHYELGKLMDTFGWDKRLLKTVLDTSNWPIERNFSKQSLGLAIYRQAVGLTQHHSFDVFYKLPNLLPLKDIPTLDDLADILFAV